MLMYVDTMMHVYTVLRQMSAALPALWGHCPLITYPRTTAWTSLAEILGKVSEILRFLGEVFNSVLDDWHDSRDTLCKISLYMREIQTARCL